MPHTDPWPLGALRGVMRNKFLGGIGMLTRSMPGYWGNGLRYPRWARRGQGIWSPPCWDQYSQLGGVTDYVGTQFFPLVPHLAPLPRPFPTLPP